MIRLLALTAIATYALTAQTASGRWMGTVDAFGSPLKIYLSLQQQSFDLTGTVMYGGAILPIEHAFVNGNEAAFETRDRSGHRIQFRLAISTGRLQGEANFGSQTAHVDVTPLTPDEPVVILAIETDAKGHIANIRIAHTLGAPPMPKPSRQCAK